MCDREQVSANPAGGRSRKVLKAIKKGAATAAQVEAKTGLGRRQIYAALGALTDRGEVLVTRRRRGSVYSLA